MYKYSIFLMIAAATFFVFFEGCRSPFYNPINIEDKSSRYDVSELFLIKGYNIFVEKEKYIERGHATFTIIKIEKVSTVCGDVDVLLSFFNNELVSIKYIEISSEIFDKNICMNAIMNDAGIHGSNFSRSFFIREGGYYYDVIFSDNILDKEIIKWANEWS